MNIQGFIPDDDLALLSLDIDSIQKLLEEDNSEINPYYPRFKSHQFDLVDLGNSLELNFSKQGLVELKNSSQDR